MANIKSQKKRVLTNEKAHQRNKAVKSELKTATKKVHAAIEAGDAAAAHTAALDACRETLAGLPTFDGPTIEAALREVPERVGIKPKVAFQAVRVAVSGTTVSPPLFESLELLGKERTLARIDAARKQAAE